MRRVRCFEICCIALSVLSFTASSSKAAITRVCIDCDVQSVEAAIDSCMPHDTIEIDGAHDVGSLVIVKPVKLFGINSASLNSTDGGELLAVRADSVFIENICFRGVTTNYLKENAAIRIIKSKYFRIRRNRIENCFFAIYLEHASNGVVEENEITGDADLEAGSGNGVHAWYCEKIEVTGNTIEGHRDGIYFEFVNNSAVRKNISRGNTRYGLHFMFSNDDEYSDNTFQNNGVGVAVMFSRRITMVRNNFDLNWGSAAYGLLLKEIYDAEIAENRFYKNTIGIFVEGSNRIDYHHNSFSKNGWAIKFSGGCELNEIHHNDFVNNSMDLVISSRISDNRIHHNYWSGYSGYDLNRDQIGDVPYYPVKLFTYVVEQAPEAIILMRSFFVDIINYSERVSPVFTPKEVYDDFPLMKSAL